MWIYNTHGNGMPLTNACAFVLLTYRIVHLMAVGLRLQWRRSILEVRKTIMKKQEFKVVVVVCINKWNCNNFPQLHQISNKTSTLIWCLFWLSWDCSKACSFSFWLPWDSPKALLIFRVADLLFNKLISFLLNNLVVLKKKKLCLIYKIVV